jgi:16S rRNA (guanine(1405)-N(7))-methyltransferase
VSELDALVAGLAASRKYRSLAPELLRRVARRALRGGGGPDETLKRAKRRLHQLYAAFLAPPELERVEKLVAALPPAPDEAALRATCREVLKRHASTRERSEPDARFYSEIWKTTGPPRRVVDLGCGLHPFALPWMGLASDCEYVALDVDTRIVAPIATLFRAMRQRGLAGALDLLADEGGDGAGERDDDAEESAARAALRAPSDVAFALKLLPTLERQRTDASLELLRSLDARHVVVSFPSASLSGRDKGMDSSYRRVLEGLLQRLAPASAGPGTAPLPSVAVASAREPTWVVSLAAAP